jgi:hypothetical protein
MLIIVSSIAHPGYSAFLAPGSGMVKKSVPYPSKNFSDHFSESLLTYYFGLQILKIFFNSMLRIRIPDPDPGSKNPDPRSGIQKIQIRDLGWNNPDRYKHPGSATQF